MATVDASAVPLISNDPEWKIVAAFVDSLTSEGVTASVSSPTSCFTVTSCSKLGINNTPAVPEFPLTLTFNPTISQVAAGPPPLSLDSRGLALALLLSGLLGLACFRRLRTRNP